MSASPLITGRAYTVRHRGQVLVVMASHPCVALAIAARVLLGGAR